MLKKWLLASMMTSLLLINGQVALALRVDDVTSQYIADADGVSGQDTNAGAGVKTGHIQDGAVTSSKLSQYAVTESTIAPGAVTNEKISGQIAAGKIESIGLNADTIDGLHASQFGFERRYSNIVVVAKNGGDFNTLQEALGSISDASPTNPYLIKVMPGVYESTDTRLGLRDYVDIEGSGKNITIISNTFSNIYYDSLLISAVGVHSEIRDITFSGGFTSSQCPSYLKGLDIDQNSVIVFKNVGLSLGNAGAGTAVYNSGSFTMIDSYVTTPGGSCTTNYGIYNRESNYLSIQNSRVLADSSGYANSYGVYFSANPQKTTYTSVVNSHIRGGSAFDNEYGNVYLVSNNSIFENTSIYYYAIRLKETDTFQAAFTRIDGVKLLPSANTKMFNCYNKNYVAITN